MDKDIETMVAKIEARAAKATPGPWEANDSVISAPSRFGGAWACDVVTADSQEDTAFIAHAREDVPKLCAMWREQQRRIQSHEHWLDGLRAAWDIPKGTTIHEFMKAMAAERNRLRDRVAKLEAGINEMLVAGDNVTKDSNKFIVVALCVLGHLRTNVMKPPPPTQP